MAVKVAINGYGTVGRRVADAVTLQDDMKVIGVVKTKPTFEAHQAIEKGFPLYVNVKGNMKAFEESGLKVEGTAKELIEDADVIVDGSPDGIGVENKHEMYMPKKKKAIFQGGEKPIVADASFNSTSNYRECYGNDFLRVVSCNTTGLCRTLFPIHSNFGINRVSAVMIRRGPDPANIKKGPVNAIVPDPVTVPSHHGPDVNTVMRDLNITTVALKVPTTLMHMHTINATVNNGTTTEGLLDVLNKSPRVVLVKAEEGIKSTAQIMEWAKELGRTRSDLNEIAVWRESVNAKKSEIFYMQAIHQESDIVPENIDAIRAALEMESDPLASIKKTDTAMGLKPWWKYN
ncbi:MAG: type II glyceraldehyde-3-phosphate dehydrogenase [Candidatus Aenigmatarchaeota archaeon]|nr:MAG: type II glyceraldehyde-3-phosphate dehydrogenase [Candidatus Aenigmarchaeota archaeon]